MTNEEILDIRIRTAKLMGWELVKGYDIWVLSTSTRFYIDGFDLITPCVGDWKPDEDLNQARELAVKLHGNFDTPDKYIELILDNEGYCASIRYGSGFDDYVRVTANHPALALTLAALQAVEGGEK